MSHTLEWKVRIHLSEDDTGTTKAQLVLDTGSGELTALGTAHCNPADEDVPRIGDELAAGRGLSDLARQLLKAAEQDIQGMGVPEPGDRQTAGWPG
ncbi:DUF1876 domain-containing protein [Streptomyces adustus]